MRIYSKAKFQLLYSLLLGNRAIKALGVKCNNHLNGCHWQGTIGTLDQHLDKCDYSVAKCPNDCQKDNLLMKDIQYHMAHLCSQRGV